MTISTPDIVTILRRRIDQCRCLNAIPATRCCGGCEHDIRCLTEIVEVRRERDEARRAWDAASDPIDQLLLDELWSRRTDAAEANARIRQLLGDTEQLKLTVARLTEDLSRMDAVTNLLYASIEKRKLRECETP